MLVLDRGEFDCLVARRRLLSGLRPLTLGTWQTLEDAMQRNPVNPFRESGSCSDVLRSG